MARGSPRTQAQGEPRMTAEHGQDQRRPRHAAHGTGLLDGLIGNSEVGCMCSHVIDLRANAKAPEHRRGEHRVAGHHAHRRRDQELQAREGRERAATFGGACTSLSCFIHRLTRAVSDGGVYSHFTHLYALLEAANEQGVQPTYVHCFDDGRTVPRSAARYFADLIAFSSTATRNGGGAVLRDGPRQALGVHQDRGGRGSSAGSARRCPRGRASSMRLREQGEGAHGRGFEATGTRGAQSVQIGASTESMELRSHRVSVSVPPTTRGGGIAHWGCGWRRKENLKTNREPEGNMGLGMLEDGPWMVTRAMEQSPLQSGGGVVVVRRKEALIDKQCSTVLRSSGGPYRD
ncbi:hypothetical protein DFH09DRAFT_1104649 [Mycena vulgaris]|nr:hypothetical protein DFH09DRAFT_1104649 [Mycena vulgaris]